MLSARPRNTCLGWRVPGAAAGMLSGWLALSRVGFFFRGRQDGVYAGIMPWLGLTSMGMYYCSSSPWSVVG